MLHMNNSAAILKSHMPVLDAVRVGIAMYGHDPAGESNGDLVPALKWKTRIVRIRKLSAGETVSYGRRWTAQGDRTIATLPVGYADGYRRELSNSAWVLIGGKRAPVIGSICMDHCMADITHIPDVSVGDEAVLLGKQGGEEISANEMAQWISSINYEVITTIGSRVQRVYLP
jgi:alanine racemase